MSGAYVISVNKRDPQLFLKRLRKRLSDISPDDCRISYYLVSEYGKLGLRPHYHAIIFNKSKVDIRHLIEESWTLGFVCIGTVTPASITYTTKYIFKDSPVPHGAAPTFALMSRRPAIGSEFCENDEIVRFTDSHPYLVNPGGIKQRLPRFYQSRFGVDTASRPINAGFLNYLQDHPDSTLRDYNSYLIEQGREPLEFRSLDFEEEKFMQENPGATYEEYRTWLLTRQKAYEDNKLKRIKHNRLL